LESDLQQLVKAGLVTHDWKQGPHKGIVTTSIVALGVRKGNPKAIQGWEDLTKPGVEVLYPSPKTSGGAMWDVIAIYGAGLNHGKQQGLAGPAWISMPPILSGACNVTSRSWTRADVNR
jgi:ABC-type sulfate transport system substrate-binding protein